MQTVGLLYFFYCLFWRYYKEKNQKKSENWSYSDIFFSSPDPKSEKKSSKSTNKQILALMKLSMFNGAMLLTILVEVYPVIISVKLFLHLVCPPIRGDNPRAFTSGLTCEYVETHVITILHHLHQCRPCTSRGISL